MTNVPSCAFVSVLVSRQNKTVNIISVTRSQREGKYWLLNRQLLNKIKINQKKPKEYILKSKKQAKKEIILKNSKT
jgi:hypothetical protein